jgi:hypothetical protein
VARRSIRVIDVVELLQHWHAGRRIGELSSSLGVDPKTIRKYTAPALDAGISPGGPALGYAEWATLVWSPSPTAPSSAGTCREQRAASSGVARAPP